MKGEMRVGYGYDLHRLVQGHRLLLCGLEIEHEKGSAGHSDADVALHALIDALLGAAALGDIGRLFPDTDPQYKDADSIELLRQVVQLITDNGWQVGNVDITIIAERPRLAPHINTMRSKVAENLGILIEQVSVKAKTNERVDAIGREEAIAAHAIALINR